MDLRFAKWEVSCDTTIAGDFVDAHGLQSGKQGENKNLATANASAMAEAAGQEAK